MSPLVTLQTLLCLGLEDMVKTLHQLTTRCRPQSPPGEKSSGKAGRKAQQGLLEAHPHQVNGLAIQNLRGRKRGPCPCNFRSMSVFYINAFLRFESAVLVSVLEYLLLWYSTS